MYNIFAAIALISIAGLVIGLIRPGWLRFPSRLHVMAIFSTAGLVFLFLFAVTSPSSPKPSQSPNTGPTAGERVPGAETPELPTKLPTTATLPVIGTDFKNLNSNDRRQAFARALADEFVSQNNLTILRAWARGQKTSAPEFASAATIRANISRSSNDFALYKNEQIFTALYVSVLEAEGGRSVLDQVLKKFE